MSKKKPLYRPEEFDDREFGPSKSQLKRDSVELQNLGTEFAALGDKVIREAELPPGTGSGPAAHQGPDQARGPAQAHAIRGQAHARL